MRKLNAALFSAAIVLGATASMDASAGGGYRGGGHYGGGHYHGGYHARVGVYFGAPLFYSPWYYPYAYSYPAPYYYPAPVAAYSGPTTYVEQAQEAAPPAPGPRSDNSWYYCPGAKAYYPYVQQCAGGWQRVSPQPPPS